MSNEKMRNLINTLDQIAEGQKQAFEALPKDVLRAAAKGLPPPAKKPATLIDKPSKPPTGKGSLTDKPSPKLSQVDLNQFKK